MKKQQSGFTLVEIAIVMVIIGLLLGGVLKGQEVITNARIKNINNDFSAISAAIYSYQDRYRAIPGDDLAANAHTGAVESDNGAGGTAGDGIIDGAYDDATAAVAAAADDSESNLAWLHLRASGLITGAETSGAQPTNSYGGLIGLENGAGNTAFGGLTMVFAAVPFDIANLIETTNGDGGDPDTGSIRMYAAPDTAGSYTAADGSVALVFDM